MGQPLSIACSFSGISKPSFYKWSKMGKRKGAPPELVQFSAEVDKAREAARVMAVGSVFKGMQKDWKAAAWFLGVTKPAEFGQKVRVTLEEEFTGAIENLEQDFGDNPELLGKILSSIARRRSRGSNAEAGVEAVIPEPVGDPDPT